MLAAATSGSCGLDQLRLLNSRSDVIGSVFGVTLMLEGKAHDRPTNDAHDSEGEAVMRGRDTCELVNHPTWYHGTDWSLLGLKGPVRGGAGSVEPKPADKQARDQDQKEAEYDVPHRYLAPLIRSWKLRATAGEMP
jgi:hypothetical protein